jgi:integrase
LEGVGGRSRRVRGRPVRLRPSRQLPETLSAEQIAVLLGACVHLRDRLLIALLAETGMRVGQVLGLHHSDVVSRERTVRIVPRADNENGARAKCRDVAEIPVSAGLVRLYSEYLFTEYGDIDSDYVFVNLFADPVGRPLGYSAVSGLVERLRARTGISFSLHRLRHSAASEWIRGGVPIEVVSKLLTHANVATTSGTYVHLGVEDLRAELARAGVR